MKKVNITKNAKLLMLGAATLLFSTTQAAAQVQFSGTVNSGSVASAIGFRTQATGSQAFSSGYYTTASGGYSTVFGYRSTASGYQSIAGGHWSTSAGRYSIALGARAITASAASHAVALGIDVRANANRSMTFGAGVGNGAANAIQNNIPYSLMIGFNSTVPTFFVGPSSGAGTVGRVGVGTTTPTSNFEVEGATNPSMSLLNGSGNRLQFGVSNCNGCYDSFSKSGDGVVRVLGGGDLLFSIPGTGSNRKIAFHTGDEQVLTIQEIPAGGGKVGVGTTNFPTTIGGANISNYNLFVAGGILTDEVRVRTGWADYVFADDYKLPTLIEVGEFIDENGHLPNVPSAAQVEAEGIEIGEMTRIQQEKIEELTLYMIEMQKQIEALTLKLEAQEN